MNIFSREGYSWLRLLVYQITLLSYSRKFLWNEKVYVCLARKFSCYWCYLSGGYDFVLPKSCSFRYPPPQVRPFLSPPLPPLPISNCYLWKFQRGISPRFRCLARFKNCFKGSVCCKSASYPSLWRSHVDPSCQPPLRSRIGRIGSTICQRYSIL